MIDNLSKAVVPPSGLLAEPLTEPINNPSPGYTRVVEAEEDGYRRGYHHGFHAALEAVGLHLAPAVLEQVWAFLDHELSLWRNYAAGGSHPPPILKLACAKPQAPNQERHQAQRQAGVGRLAPHHPPAGDPVSVLVVAPASPVLSSQGNHRKGGDPWVMASKVRRV
jgi:hypothetical protein